MAKKKHNYRVMYTVLTRGDGDIIHEQSIMDVKAVNSAWAQVACVQAIRSEFPNETHRIIVHESIWYEPTIDNDTDVELLTDD